MRTRSISHILLVLAALAFLPLRTDGGQAECCNATTSLASTVNDPVNGDEAFFKLPTGPANVMLLLDVSGSMINFPQCGDNGWDSGVSTCATPGLSAPPTSTTSLFTITGTCTPSTFSAPMAWMESVVPQIALPDPGRSNSLLTDAPPWGGSCTGNACLFDPNAYFFYGDWSSSSSGASSTRRASDTDATLPAGCTAFDTSGNVIKDINNNPINLGSACTTCMTQHGYFFYRVTKATRLSGGVPNRWSTVDGNPLFKGTFLNANPPKFVTARKVLKDLAWMDPASPSKLDQVRLGLSILDSSGTSPRKARLIVPLGPDKNGSFPPTQAGFAQARQYILSVVNYDQAVYKDASNNTIINGTTITGGFFDPANGSTPLASALFNVGQYFTSLNRYNTLLGSAACSGKSCQTSAFNETAAGDVNAPWASGGSACSICWACQNNSVVVITDGAPNSEITFPNTISTYDNNAYNAAQNCGTAPNCGGAIVPRVTSWLHNSDLRDDKVMSGKQALTVHTIGIHMIDPTAINVLRATANMGGGMYQNASDPASLAAAVINAVNQVIPKENTFSAASANSLQTVQTAASVAYLSRFKPNQTITWEGHVFEAFLFDEFLNGCDPTLTTQPQVTCGPKTVSADFNGDGLCNGAFLVDSDCDEVAEDTQTGDFVKKGQAIPANLPWDAGQVLSDPTKTGYRSADETAANARNIFTWVNGSKVPFTSANATTLLPLMNIGSAWCTSFLTRIGVPGGSNPTLTCAQQVIYFVRGWDVLDQDSDGCAGPGNLKNTASCKSGTNGEERDRANDSSTGTKFFWKLGDIFHSSPAVLTAPIDEIRCDTGYEKQCVATLHSPPGLPNQTPIASYTDSKGNPIDAYAKYRLNNITRKRVVLVGANDGMLHAFDAGTPDTSQPADVTGSFPYSNGTGEELWAFIPPDLLPRLKGLVDAHQYMVDGSVMLRDIWVDGIGSQVSSVDRTKQSDEYRTVAIVGRRSGGTAYSALDVTDPLNPKPLWSFPQGCTDDARYMGESWSDFAPRPPPMGPVKMASTKDPRGFEERWIVMINGGYDPTLTLGRVVYMLDAWTGNTVWRFTDADFKAQTGYGSGTSLFPVPAAIGLVDIGDPTQQASDADGFFDTATWGDLGGNLWVARFQAPGVIDATTNRVNNWFAARTFEQRRQTDDSQLSSGRNEFYFMTANAYEPTSRTLRTYLGSGNREQIMSRASSCGTDNLFACCQAGCTKVTATTTENFGACNGSTTFSCVNGTLTYATSTTATCGSATATCAASPGNAFTSAVTLHWECPGSGTVPDSTGTVSCDGSGLCSVTPVGSKQVTGTFNAQSHNRFYGVWAYGRDPHKMFSDQASALAFDKNRFTDVSYSGSCTGPKGNACALVDTTQAKVAFDTSNPLLVNTTCGGGVTTCSATVDDAGWFYEYGDVCPLSSCNPAPPWTDEKTGSGASIVLGCTTWGSFRPVGASGSTDPCSGSLGVPVSYAYTAHYVSGTPNPSACGSLVLAYPRSITAPPSGPTVRVDVKPGGQISYSTLRMDPGSPPSTTQVGTRTQVTEPVYWLEVPRDLHSCRHVSAASCP